MVLNSPDSADPGPSILVADDEQGIRVVVEKILMRGGYRVLMATDAADALDLGRRHPGTIDLLVSDFSMPGMSGQELARRMVASQPTIRVLFMSGSLDPPEGSGAATKVRVLQKPFNRTELLEAVAAALASG